MTRKKRIAPEEEEDVRVLVAAWLSGQGHLQKDIADQMGTKQPEVSRLLDKAEKKGWLKKLSPLFTCPDEKSGLLELGKSRLLSTSKLTDHLRGLCLQGKSRLRGITMIHRNHDGVLWPSVADA